MKSFAAWLATNALAILLALGGVGGVVWAVSKDSATMTLQGADHGRRLDQLEPRVRQLELDRERVTTELRRVVDDLRQLVDDFRSLDPRRQP